PPRHLHDFGRPRRGLRRADRADDAICRARHPQPRSLGRGADHADHRRGRAALWRVHRRAALHDRAGPLFADRAGLLVFLDRAADGDHRAVRPRRRARALRSAASMTETNGPALETRALCKSFGALLVADSIDFRLEHGARHALIGPNGAGKTSFVNFVTGALRAAAGVGSRPRNIAGRIIDPDMDLVLRLARRITVMVEGRILVAGPPEAIAGEPQVRQAYLGERARGSARQ